MAVGNDLILPSIPATLSATAQVATQSNFFQILGFTLLRVFGGIAISILAGAVLGILCGMQRWLYELIAPLTTVIRTLPVVSVIILINLWVRSGIVPLVVSFLVCFPIIWTNVVEGYRNTDPDLLEMARVFGVGRSKVLWQIYVPSIRPYMMAAMMNAIGMGWKATVTAEVLGNALPSVGMQLYYSKIYLETPTLFAWTLVLVIASFAIEKATAAIFSRKDARDGYSL